MGWVRRNTRGGVEGGEDSGRFVRSSCASSDPPSPPIPIFKHTTSREAHPPSRFSRQSLSPQFKVSTAREWSKKSCSRGTILLYKCTISQPSILNFSKKNLFRDLIFDLTKHLFLHFFPSTIKVRLVDSSKMRWWLLAGRRLALILKNSKVFAWSTNSVPQVIT